MKTQIHFLLLTAAILAIAVLPLCAQVVADGATNTLNGGTTTIAGDVTVGTNGSFTLLILTNNALLTNSGFAYIGDNAGANFNAVWLTGTNSRWLMGGSAFVGLSGSGSRLVISNGARVGNTSGRLGYTALSSNNEAVVTGAGSLWSNRFELTVGESGLGNRLVITSGGTVFSSNSVGVGVESGAVNNFLLLSTGALLTNIYDGVLGANAGANSNTAFVSDLNSRWLMGGNLHVGSNGAFNWLVITNGARVRDDYGYLGDTPSSSNNQAVVTGAGSLWTNRFGLHVGNSGSGNRLEISNGGVARDLNGLLGLDSTSSNNVAVVTGAGSLWTNEADLFVGYAGAGNQLVVSDSGVVRNNIGYIGLYATSSNNVAVVTGSSSLWSSTNNLYIGDFGSFNQLVVSNGGLVAGTWSTVGHNYGANGNSVLVTGVGSLLTNTYWLNIGSGTSFNQLIISNGGVVADYYGSEVGTGSESKSNKVLVAGAGSLWTNNSLTIGSYGSFNQLVISDGGVVANREGWLGNGSGANSNSVLVTGAGSLWYSSGTLFIGKENGSYSQLTVTISAVVRATGLVFLGAVFAEGFDTIGHNNRVLAVGGSINSVGLTLGGHTSRDNSITLLSSSAWDMGGGTLTWGDAGSNNTLTIDATSALTNIGALTLDENDTAFFLTNAPGGYMLNGFTTNQLQFKPAGLGALVVGNDGTNVQLTIRDYTLAGTTGTIGGSTNARNNSVLVTGAGSVWSNSAALKIGNHGSFNQLAINNGGVVASPSGTLGVSSGADFNLVLVNGLNSLWKNNGALTNGGAGSFNQLVLSDGGVVANTTGTVGSTGSNNLVLITGAGSLWSNSSTLFIGDSGAFNQLVVSDGGVVANTTGTVGSRSTATGNSAFVTGAGSLWTNSSDLSIGRDGSLNQLVVSNGSMVVNALGLVGLNAGANSNSVLVTGTGSLWSSSGALSIGDFGALNQLVLNNRGVVRNTTGTVGAKAGANSNSVVVTGAGSLWTNSSDLLLGGGGASNQLVISDGGVVADASGTVANIVGRNGNSVLVTGTGSLWTNSGSLTLGSAGAFNQLVISNSGAVRAGGAVTLGGFAGATNNSVLAVGGSLASVGLTLGNAVSRNNSVMLLSNSTWNVGGGTFIWGNAGFNDTLVIDASSALTNIGALTLDENDTTFYLTNAPGGYSLNGFTTNQLQFKPTGLGAVIVGNSGTNVQLTISSYTLADTTGTVGRNAGANSNSVLVTGAGSVWSNSSTLFIGSAGAFNQLLLSNGGMVANSSGTVGGVAGANSNSVVVTGAGSRWSNSSDLLLGGGGAFNQLVISDGGAVRNASGTVASLAGRNGNSVLVTGAGSLWSNSSSLAFGSAGAFNQLVINEGGLVANTSGTVGGTAGANSNSVVVTGAGSRWTNSSSLTLGGSGAFNQLVINDGGLVANTSGTVGGNSGANSNSVVVTGAGSLWSNSSSLTLGSGGAFNQLVLSDGGIVFASNAVYLGFNSTSSSNLLTVGGGGLVVTNPAGSSVLDIRRGTSILNSGTMTADRLLLTNSQGFFTFNGGTLKTKGTTNSNGQVFTVGNGASTATFELAGNGLHTFSSGLAIANNASLRGNGTISGTLTVAMGGTLSPGTSVGKIVLNSPPVLLGNAFMEISRNGAALTNDQVQVAGTLTYGGSLTVSNRGPGALTVGNSFPLFSASGYGGAFATLSLPALDNGLAWTNKLLMNGSIEVVGVAAPKFATITLSGTNVIIAGTDGTPNAPYAVLTSTNVALPVINWTSIATNQFGPGGEFSFTNGIAPGIPQLFYRIRTP
jgi:T5SS/PEP-CTERM-associated repeat protein